MPMAFLGRGAFPFKSLTSANSTIILDAPLLSHAIFQVMSTFKPSPDIPETRVQISNTNLTGLTDVFAGAHNISRMTFNDTPLMYQLSLGILHIRELQVHRNGGLTLDFTKSLSYGDSDVSSVGLLNITGLRNKNSKRWPYNINSGLVMDMLIAARNNMTKTGNRNVKSVDHTRTRQCRFGEVKSVGEY